MGEDELTVKPYTSDYYPMLCDWWASHGAQKATEADLRSATGLIVESDSEPFGACFLLVSGAIGFVEALVIKPNSTVTKSRKASEKLFNEIKKLAKSKGVTKLIAFVASKGMVRECKRTGFSQAGPVMAQMIQEI